MSKPSENAEARRLRAEVAALEQLLEVHEQSVLEQSDRLEQTLQELRAEIAERRQAERRLAVQYTATRVLAESPTLDEAFPQILQAICESLGWQLGAIFVVQGGPPKIFRRAARELESLIRVPVAPMTTLSKDCLPSTMVLLAETNASAPMAVA